MNEPSSSDRSTAGSGVRASIRCFGDYVLLGEIASGGMGVVFNARQVSLNRRVAVKLIRAGQLASETERRRFKTEAEAAARLDHPNIVPIYEIGEHEGQPFLVMKLIDGDNLAECLADGSHHRAPVADERGVRPGVAFGFRETAMLLVKLSEAIAHAHQRGVLHRDIKPANILIDAAGEPILTDFGLAKLFEGGGGPSPSSLAGAIIGTPAYMSPEQAAGGPDAVGAAADIYSLGAVLYSLLTGQAPFSGRSIGETLDRVRREEPRRPRDLDPRIPVELEAIGWKCLRKDPAGRYSSAQELADDLRRWLAGERVAVDCILTRRSPVGWLRRHAVAAAGAGMAAALVLAGIVAVMGPGWRQGRAATGFEGQDIAWQNVSGARVQAVGGESYRLNSREQVLVTLPLRPRIGDVIRISGDNPGGWRLGLNSNQVIKTENLGPGVGDAGWHWRLYPDDRQWSGVAISGDGSKLAAVDFGFRNRGGQVQVSSDGGATWSQRGNQRYWNSCALSADGSTLAVTSLGKLYVSTNLGLTWTTGDERRNWRGIASSADGMKLVAVDNGTNVEGGFIYTSKNRGASWQAGEHRANWFHVASSADGGRLAAAPGEANIKGEVAVGFVHISGDGGQSWTVQLADRERRWLGLGMSTDGAVLVALEDNAGRPPGGRVHFSRDFGITWEQAGPVTYWSRLALSPDGRLWMAARRENPESPRLELVISTDWGANWRVVADRRDWAGFAFSADKRRWVAAAGHFDLGHGSGIFLSDPTTVPGPDGRVEGAAGAAVELRFEGDDQFGVVSGTGAFTVDGVPFRIEPGKLQPAPVHAN